MDILKAEIAKKRKLLEEKNLIVSKFYKLNFINIGEMVTLLVFF